MCGLRIYRLQIEVWLESIQAVMGTLGEGNPQFSADGRRSHFNPTVPGQVNLDM